MADVKSDHVLTTKAVSGDADALTALLWEHYGRLLASIKRKLPQEFRGVVDAEDILQDTHIEVFQSIGKFEARGEDAFYRWLVTIAEQRLLDKIKELRRKKRGGGRKRVHAKLGVGSSSVGTLLDIVAKTDGTPSRSVARRERAVSVALAGLKKDYRDALQLRYIEGLPVASIAKRLDRTERAVHMLCNRGLKRLREAMGSASAYFTRR